MLLAERYQQTMDYPWHQAENFYILYVDHK